MEHSRKEYNKIPIYSQTETTKKYIISNVVNSIAAVPSTFHHLLYSVDARQTYLNKKDPGTYGDIAHYGSDTYTSLSNRLYIIHVSPQIGFQICIYRVNMFTVTSVFYTNK